MNKNTQKNICIGMILIVLGILFCVLQGSVIGYAMTILGAVCIGFGIFNIIKKFTERGIIQIVVGALVILFGWVLAFVMIYLLAIALIVYGVLDIYIIYKSKIQNKKIIDLILIYAFPVVNILLGFLLLFNQAGTLNAIFIVAGILFIIEGVMYLVEAKTNNKDCIKIKFTIKETKVEKDDDSKNNDTKN